jgi:hypothetical protein
LSDTKEKAALDQKAKDLENQLALAKKAAATSADTESQAVIKFKDIQTKMEVQVKDNLAMKNKVTATEKEMKEVKTKLETETKARAKIQLEYPFCSGLFTWLLTLSYTKTLKHNWKSK